MNEKYKNIKDLVINILGIVISSLIISKIIDYNWNKIWFVVLSSSLSLFIVKIILFLFQREYNNYIQYQNSKKLLSKLYNFMDKTNEYSKHLVNLINRYNIDDNINKSYSYVINNAMEISDIMKESSYKNCENLFLNLSITLDLDFISPLTNSVQTKAIQSIVSGFGHYLERKIKEIEEIKDSKKWYYKKS